MFIIAGVAPVVSPVDLSHFVHGLFACASNQVFLTFIGKVSFSNCLCKCSKDPDSVVFVDCVKEFIIVEFNSGEESVPTCPPSVKLGISGGCAGGFSGSADSSKFIQEIICCGSGLM